MKKQELLKLFDDELPNKLFGFGYARTRDSYEAEELCSDITYALIKAESTDEEIKNFYSFIWKVAGNVYADFSKYRLFTIETVFSKSVLAWITDTLIQMQRLLSKKAS